LLFKRGDDIVDGVEMEVITLGGSAADAIRKSAPGEQRVFDGSRAPV